MIVCSLSYQIKTLSIFWVALFLVAIHAQVEAAPFDAATEMGYHDFGVSKYPHATNLFGYRVAPVPEWRKALQHTEIANSVIYSTISSNSAISLRAEVSLIINFPHKEVRGYYNNITNKPHVDAGLLYVHKYILHIGNNQIAYCSERLQDQSVIIGNPTVQVSGFRGHHSPKRLVLVRQLSFVENNRDYMLTLMINNPNAASCYTANKAWKQWLKNCNQLNSK